MSQHTSERSSSPKLRNRNSTASNRPKASPKAPRKQATNQAAGVAHLSQDTDPNAQAVAEAIEAIASSGSQSERGSVYTRSEVVEFILDLIGYTEEKELYRKRILEPSFGGGDFLLVCIERLMRSWQSHKAKQQHDKPHNEDQQLDEPYNEAPQHDASQHEATQALSNAIRAVELHRDTYDQTFEAVLQLLQRYSLAECEARDLANQWLIQGDFLLAEIDGSFDYVVGNPPYVRQELIPKVLLSEYRKHYKTMCDRADLYVPFIERSLGLLTDTGTLGFICSDRWMKNRYGAALRSMVSENYHLKTYIDMTGTEAFHSDVAAYTAITVISREAAAAAASTRVVHQPTIDSKVLKSLAKELTTTAEPKAKRSPRSQQAYELVEGVTNGSEPWLFDRTEQLKLLRRLESSFPLLEEAGCKVGIGLATGADKAFIGEYDKLDVEPNCKLKLATTKDIASGKVQWIGQGVINPFKDNGELVDLQEHPRLQQYLEERREVIANRYCAKKNPSKWYCTIDRITPELATRPKLLIPDIKGQTHVVYEAGELYPHHNLYYIISDAWDLRALQAVLLSSISKFFVESYSTKMRGGYLRFQAQYLRRIHIPHWSDVPASLRRDLTAAAEALDIDACNRAAFRLYGLTPAEQTALPSAECPCA